MVVDPIGVGAKPGGDGPLYESARSLSSLDAAAGWRMWYTHVGQVRWGHTHQVAGDTICRTFATYVVA